jgi:CheY-like chemotaxis protein
MMSAIGRGLTGLHEHMRVLVAEDDVILRGLLVRRLVRQGYLVREARDGHETMELLRHGPLPNETLLLDVHMPGRNGLEVVEALRARGIQCPVVLMSATVNDEVMAQARACAVAAVLEKPFESTSLETAIANAEHLTLLALAHTRAPKK